MECVQLAAAFGCAELFGASPGASSLKAFDSGSKLHALHTLREVRSLKPLILKCYLGDAPGAAAAAKHCQGRWLITTLLQLKKDPRNKDRKRSQSAGPGTGSRTGTPPLALSPGRKWLFRVLALAL